MINLHKLSSCCPAVGGNSQQEEISTTSFSSPLIDLPARGEGVELQNREISVEHPRMVDSHEEYCEFTRRLHPEELAIIGTKWDEISNIEHLAKTLAKDLKESPYETELFFDKDIEFIALYGLDKGLLTIYETANLFLFKSACDTYGKEKITIHFLIDKTGKIDELEREWFRSAASNIFYALSCTDSERNQLLDSPLNEVNLPRHQFVFFSTPEDKEFSSLHNESNSIRNPLLRSKIPFFLANVDNKQQRIIMTPELLQEYFYKLLPKRDHPRARPVLGLSSPSDFEDFLTRDLYIPCSLSPAPEKADSCFVRVPLNMYIHDLYHFITDLCNPHLRAFQELLKIVKEMPYVKDQLVHRNLYENYLDRDCNIYRYKVCSKGPKPPMNESFWEALSSLFGPYGDHFTYKRGFILESALEGIINYIADNEERWNNQYGINFIPLKKRSKRDVRYGGHSFVAIHSLAKKYFSRPRPYAETNNDRRGFSWLGNCFPK